METKPLLFGLIGFFIGGLLVSIAATTFDKPQSDMKNMVTDLKELSGDEYDAVFIRSMIEHHEAAVDMAKLSDKRAKHRELKSLSSEIVTAQNSEITEMRQWQREWGYESGQSEPSHSSMSH